MSPININKDYPCNVSNYSQVIDKDNSYIVVHYVGAIGSALNNAQYFANHINLQASANFFVGHASENGSIYQSVDPKDRAWHCGAEKGQPYKHPYCRNANSIGIEMCCHLDAKGNWYFDDVTITQTIELIKYLMEQFSIPVTNVIRHFDVTGKLCPAPFVVNEAAWQNFKSRLEESKMPDKTGDNPSDWAKVHTEWAKAKKIINGDGRGNYDWQGMPTREGLATILHNFAIAYGLEKE